jgi:hypothetical protein
VKFAADWEDLILCLRSACSPTGSKTKRHSDITSLGHCAPASPGGRCGQQVVDVCSRRKAASAETLSERPLTQTKAGARLCRRGRRELPLCGPSQRHSGSAGPGGMLTLRGIAPTEAYLLNDGLLTAGFDPNSTCPPLYCGNPASRRCFANRFISCGSRYA